MRKIRPVDVPVLGRQSSPLLFGNGYFFRRAAIQTMIRNEQLDYRGIKNTEPGFIPKQVEGSPEINTPKPVSRQHEADYLAYYGYPFFWEGPNLWGSMTDPAGLAIQRSVVAEASASRTETESADSHLRSTEEVTGYHIEATDGQVKGKVGGQVLSLPPQMPSGAAPAWRPPMLAMSAKLLFSSSW